MFKLLLYLEIWYSDGRQDLDSFQPKYETV
jgi:hypothetical protein